jgi:deoxyuridine 5'-triphosphate nucleotidohydrolase
MFEKEAEEKAKDYAEHNQGKYTNEFGNIYHAFLAGAEFSKEHDKDIEIPFKGESPVYSTKQAAGADIALPKDIIINAHSIVTWIDLEVGFDIPEGFCIMLQPRSSTSRKWHVLCDTGIIDSDYKLENIHCGLVNITNEDIAIPKGTRIVQLLILPVYHATNWKCLNNIRDSKKGSGSTGD